MYVLTPQQFLLTLAIKLAVFIYIRTQREIRKRKF